VQFGHSYRKIEILPKMLLLRICDAVAANMNSLNIYLKVDVAMSLKINQLNQKHAQIQQIGLAFFQ